MARQGHVSDLYFGFDPERLLVRLDARGGPVREKLADVTAVRLVFLQPQGFVLTVAGPARRDPAASLLHDEVLVADAGVQAAADLIFELAVPFRSLAVDTGDPVHFCVELLEGDAAAERVPAEGAIETAVPSPDYELIMWQA